MRPTIRVCAGIAMMAAIVSRDTVAQPVHEVQIAASRPGFEPATIQVFAGEAVRLVIRSTDVPHGFAVPGLKINAHIPEGGEAVTVEFIAPPPGRFEIACSEFCGRNHARMKAALISLPRE